MSDIKPGMTYDRVVLDWEQVASTAPASRVMLQDARTDVVEDILIDQLVYTLRGYILAGAPVDVTVSVAVPDRSTHWQRFLWFATADASTRLGRWLQERVDRRTPYTTKSQTRTVNRNICPHGVIAKEPHRAHLEWLSEPPVDWSVE